MERQTDSVLAKDIEILDLSVRSYRCLISIGIKTIEDLINLDESELLKTKNFGSKSLKEINSKLMKFGLYMGMKKLEHNHLSHSQKLFLNKNIESCDFSIRSFKCLRYLNIKTISDLVKMKESDLRKKKNFGEKSLIEIKLLLSKYNLCLGMSTSEDDLKVVSSPKDQIYPLFQSSPYDFDISERIESKFLNIDLSLADFKEKNLILLKKLNVERFIDLLYIPYRRILDIYGDEKKARRIIKKAYLFLNKIINEYNVECKSINDWLIYAKDELSGEKNFRRVFKKEKYIEVFKGRYFKKKGETFREIAQKVSMSPEGVRRICSIVLDLMYKSLKLPYRTFVDSFIIDFKKNKGLLVFDEDSGIIDSFEFRLFNFIISHRNEKITFDNCAKVWRENNNDILIKINKFLEERLEEGVELSKNRIDSIALEFILEYDFTHYNQSAISNLFINYHFDIFREKYFYKKKSNTKIFENIIKCNFPDGIAIHKKKDVFIETLKKSGYSDIVNLSERTIIQQAVESENIVLWDWGVYIHKDNIRIEKKTLEKIKEWVQEKLNSGAPRVSLYGAFFEFEEECIGAGIPNEHALHTCMKLNYANNFSFLRVPYLYPKRTTKGVESTEILENYLLKFKEGIKKTQIKAELGLRNYQVEQRIYESDKILSWGYGKVIHIDNIFFNSEDLEQIIRWIKRNINKYNHLSILRVFEENIVLCKKNKISNERQLYAVLNKYNSINSFLLPVYPLIINVDHGIDDDGYFSFNDLFNHYFSSKEGIITKQQLDEYFVKARGYRKNITDLVTDICDEVIRYTKNSFVTLQTIGWSDSRASALEHIAEERFKRNFLLGQPFSFIEDLLEMESLPGLEGNISWQKILLTELLSLHDNIKVLGTMRDVYIFIPNELKIETNEDIMHFVLKDEFGGGVNKTKFEKRLKELKIATKLNPKTRYSFFTIQGEEVFIK